MIGNSQTFCPRVNKRCFGRRHNQPTVGGYSGPNLARVVRQICGANVEVIKRISKTFEILPKRWMVERIFGWLNRYRRLSKDYETHVENSEAMIYGSLIRLMIRRFAL